MTENRFVMISEWMVNGSIDEFVKARADADRLKLVRLPFKVLILIRHRHLCDYLS